MQENPAQSQLPGNLSVLTCPSCGRGNPPATKHCAWCTSELPQPDAPAARSRVTQWSNILLIIVVVVCVVFGVLLFGLKQDTAQVNSTLSGQILANALPTDETQFGKYIERMHPTIGNHPLVFVANDSEFLNGEHDVILGLGTSSVDYILFDASRADLRAWATAVASDAKKAWPEQTYSITLDWTYHTEQACTECSSICQFQSSTYTNGKGWFHANIAVEVDNRFGVADVNVCEGK